MLHLGLIQNDYINDVKIMVEYLANNNIFKYERREFLEDGPDDIKEILATIRAMYWQSKK